MENHKMIGTNCHLEVENDKIDESVAELVDFNRILKLDHDESTQHSINVSNNFRNFEEDNADMQSQISGLFEEKSSLKQQGQKLEEEQKFLHEEILNQLFNEDGAIIEDTETQQPPNSSIAYLKPLRCFEQKPKRFFLTYS